MSATVLPARADIQTRSFLPSSRSVAYRKTVWEAAGGYPEWLDYCEDLVFDFAVMAHTGGFVFVPDAIGYFRPRDTLRAFFKQYYLYARGDGKAGLWRNRHLLRYGVYLIGLPVLLAGIALLTAPWSWLSALALLFGAAGYLRTPFRRLRALWSGLSLAGKAQSCALVPVIRLTGDLAKMAGYPVGLRWRALHRPGV